MTEKELIQLDIKDVYKFYTNETITYNLSIELKHSNSGNLICLSYTSKKNPYMRIITYIDGSVIITELNHSKQYDIKDYFLYKRISNFKNLFNN